MREFFQHLYFRNIFGDKLLLNVKRLSKQEGSSLVSTKDTNNYQET